MRAHIRFGRWLGIPVGLHYSWFIIAWLITFSLAGQFSAQNPDWSATTIWTTAVVTAVLFFFGIVVHELSHALVARAGGVPVHGITLFALGGVAQIERDAVSAGREFAMAIAGPAASFVIGFACHAVAASDGWTATGPASSPLIALIGWLGYINIALGLFNLIPGFPLDGGRVLRAVIWGISGDADRSTRIAARVGQAVALLFIAFGLFGLLARGAFGGLWIAFIGWFMLEAAQASYAQTRLVSRLRGVKVGDVMAHGCTAVDARMPLEAFVQHELVKAPDGCFAAIRDGAVVGLVGPGDVKKIGRDRWKAVTVAEAMRPLAALQTVPPDAEAAEALQMMAGGDTSQIPVVRDGRFEGVVARSQILRLLKLRSELRA